MDRSAAQDYRADLNWTRMTAIQTRRTMFGNLTSALGASEEQYWHDDRVQWAALVSMIHRAFACSQTASFYNTILDRWSTCALLSSTSGEPVAFCGTNRALHLPVPCRSPKQGLDFLEAVIEGQVAPAMYEQPSSDNTGAMECSWKQIERARREGSKIGKRFKRVRRNPKTERPYDSVYSGSTTRRAEAASDPMSMPHMQRQSDALVFTVTYLPSSACSQAMYYWNCYSICCNSQWASTSYFCQSESATMCH